MKLKDLRNLNKTDILDTVGLQSKPSAAVRFFGALGILAVGVLLGAACALMFAPKSGRGLREDLSERLRRAPEDIKEVVASVTARTSEEVGPSAGSQSSRSARRFSWLEEK